MLLAKRFRHVLSMVLGGVWFQEIWWWQAGLTGPKPTRGSTSFHKLVPRIKILANWVPISRRPTGRSTSLNKLGPKNPLHGRTSEKRNLLIYWFRNSRITYSTFQTTTMPKTISFARQKRRFLDEARLQDLTGAEKHILCELGSYMRRMFFGA